MLYRVACLFGAVFLLSSCATTSQLIIHDEHNRPLRVPESYPFPPTEYRRVLDCTVEDGDTRTIQDFAEIFSQEIRDAGIQVQFFHAPNGIVIVTDVEELSRNWESRRPRSFSRSNFTLQPNSFFGIPVIHLRPPVARYRYFAIAITDEPNIDSLQQENITFARTTEWLIGGDDIVPQNTTFITDRHQAYVFAYYGRRSTQISRARSTDGPPIETSLEQAGLGFIVHDSCWS